MSLSKTKIAWTDYVWNCATGCTHAGSLGCDNCWARELHNKRHKAYLEGKKLPAQYAKPFNEIQLLPERLEEPLKLRKPSKIFVCSVSDLFHESVSDWFLDRVFGTIILSCEKHTYQLLTKRIDRARDYLENADRSKWVHAALHVTCWNDPDYVEEQLTKALERNPVPNLWLGTTVTTQAEADKKIPILLQIPAAVRFVSVEPMLSRIILNGRHMVGDEEYWDFLKGERGATCQHRIIQPTKTNKLDWIIAGGESGKNARPMHPRWARELRDQCKMAGVPFFFKQWGEWYGLPAGHVRDNCTLAEDGCRWHTTTGELLSGTHKSWFDCSVSKTIVYRIGTKAAGYLLDGEEIQQFPEVSK